MCMYPTSSPQDLCWAVHRGCLILMLIWTVWNNLKHVLFGRCESGAATRSWQASFSKHHPMQHQRQLKDLAVQCVSLPSHLHFLPMFSRSDAPSFVKSHNPILVISKEMLRITWNLLKLTPFKTSGWSWTANLYIDLCPQLFAGSLLCRDVLSCSYRHITYFVIVSASYPVL